MTDRWAVFLAQLRAKAKILWAILIAAGGVLLVALFARRRARGDVPGATTVESIAVEKAQRVEAAKAEAAIRIEAAREKEGAIKAQLTEVMKDKDGARRRRNLIELNKLIDKTRRGE